MLIYSIAALIMTIIVLLMGALKAYDKGYQEALSRVSKALIFYSQEDAQIFNSKGEDTEFFKGRKSAFQGIMRVLEAHGLFKNGEIN